jgi:hypothetical protein
MDDDLKKKECGAVLETFLNDGLDTLRSCMEKCYARGHLAGFQQGRAGGTEERQKMYLDSMAHMNRWQEDRKELMPIVPGYTYMNRVDDPEWDKAKKIIIKILLAVRAEPHAKGGA